MSPSKTGLNAEFYKWIDDVRRAMRKERELHEKLRYYNMKLTSCRGISYDRIGSAGTAGGERDLYYWMDKIEETKRSLAKYQSIINEYEKFMETLDKEHKIVLQEILVRKGERTSSKPKDTTLRKGEITRLWIKSKKRD